MIGRPTRLAVTGLVGVGLALTAALWPSDGDTSTASATTVPATPDGASLFLQKGCVSCHTGPGRPSLFEIGPNLATVSAVAGERLEGLSAEEYVRQSIREPQAYRVPGFDTVNMPTLAISDAELEALVRYLLG